MWKFFFMTLLNVSSAWACFAPPESAMIPLEEMVKMNDNIYVAEVVGVGKSAKVIGTTTSIFKFKVVETLKGKPVTKIQIEAYQAKGDKSASDFNGHKDQDFWSNNTSGRLINDASCDVQPTFKKGTRYLIFPHQPYTYKSLEIVKNDDDMFLKKVRELLAAGNTKETKEIK